MAFPHAGRKGPDRNELAHIGRCDLIQGTIAPAIIRPAIHEPVFRFGLQQPLCGHGRVVLLLGADQSRRKSEETDEETREEAKRAASHLIHPYFFFLKPTLPINGPLTVRNPSLTSNGRVANAFGAGPPTTRPWFFGSKNEA